MLKQECEQPNKCSIIQNNFVLDEKFKLKKYIQINSQLTTENVNKIISDLFNGLCCSNKDNEIILDYRYFKIFMNFKSSQYSINSSSKSVSSATTSEMIENDYNFVIQYIINAINKILLNQNSVVVHVCLQSLNLTDIEKYYQFICNFSQRLKTTFPDKLEKCFIYKAPFIFSQLFSIISAFVDKNTLSKIQLIK